MFTLRWEKKLIGLFFILFFNVSLITLSFGQLEERGNNNLSDSLVESELPSLDEEKESKFKKKFREGMDRVRDHFSRESREEREDGA